LAVLVEEVAGGGRDADWEEVADLGLRAAVGLDDQGVGAGALQIDVGLAAQVLDCDHVRLEPDLALVTVIDNEMERFEAALGGLPMKQRTPSLPAHRQRLLQFLQDDP
jgi:hypothetical protein